jgi:hypothetical protein
VTQWPTLCLATSPSCLSRLSLSPLKPPLIFSPQAAASTAHTTLAWSRPTARQPDPHAVAPHHLPAASPARSQRQSKPRRCRRLLGWVAKLAGSMLICVWFWSLRLILLSSYYSTLGYEPIDMFMLIFCRIRVRVSNPEISNFTMWIERIIK